MSDNAIPPSHAYAYRAYPRYPQRRYWTKESQVTGNVWLSQFPGSLTSSTTVAADTHRNPGMMICAEFYVLLSAFFV